MNEENSPKVFTVYRMNLESKAKEPIGQIVERRKSSRLNNRVGLLRLARQQFAFSSDETVYIGTSDGWFGETNDLQFV